MPGDTEAGFKFVAILPVTDGLNVKLFRTVRRIVIII